MDKPKVMATIRELEDIERAREEGKEEEVRDLTSQEAFLLQCWQNGIKEVEIEQSVANWPVAQLETLVNATIERTNCVDFKAFDQWKEDPDCSYVVSKMA